VLSLQKRGSSLISTGRMVGGWGKKSLLSMALTMDVGVGRLFGRFSGEKQIRVPIRKGLLREGRDRPGHSGKLGRASAPTAGKKSWCNLRQEGCRLPFKGVRSG